MVTRKPWSLSPRDKLAIMAAYLRGEKVESIAAQFGLKDSSYPGRLARRRGLPLRKRGRPRLMR